MTTFQIPVISTAFIVLAELQKGVNMITIAFIS